MIKLNLEGGSDGFVGHDVQFFVVKMKHTSKVMHPNLVPLGKITISVRPDLRDANRLKGFGWAKMKQDDIK
jgi:hypothetical protein